MAIIIKQNINHIGNRKNSRSQKDKEENYSYMDMNKMLIKEILKKHYKQFMEFYPVNTVLSSSKRMLKVRLKDLGLFSLKIMKIALDFIKVKYR